MLPTFLIVGFMKSGTSALVRGIRNHDSVFSVPEKEIHYFDRHYQEGIDWYKAKFQHRGRALAVGEGTPYLGNRVATTRLLADLPEAKLIVIVRQPADRAYSHYWHNRRRGREHLSFPDALEAERSRSVPDDAIFDYMNLGFYAKHLTQVTDATPRDRLLFLRNDDLKYQRAQVLGSCWEFVGVDPDLGRVEVPERPMRRRIWRATKNRVKGRSDDRSYPPLDPGMRASLTEEFTPDILKLQDLLGRDLSDWLA